MRGLRRWVASLLRLGGATSVGSLTEDFINCQAHLSHMEGDSDVGTWGIEVLAAANYSEFEAAVDPVAREYDCDATVLRDTLADLVTAVETGREEPASAAADETPLTADTLLIGASKCRQHALRKYPTKVPTEVY